MANLSNLNNKFLVTTGGNVGIGTTSPASKLHVHGTQSYGTIRVSPTSTNGESAMAFFLDTAGTNTGTAWVVGHAGWGNTGDFVIGNQAFGGPVILAQQDGRVGIGVTGPVGKLHVGLPAYTNEDTNSQQAIFGASNGYGVRIGYNETDNKGYINVLKPGVAWGSLILQEDVGNVGIGTTTPPNKLTVNGGTESVGVEVSETQRLTIGADGNWNYFKGKSGNGHYFNTTGGGILVLNNDGKVGIGTDSPIGKTDIFVGASGYTNNITTLPVGTWSFANGSGGNSYPTLVSKSNASGAGMTLVATTDDGAPNGMDFNIRKGDNTDFSTLTTSGFTFSRFGTNLITILRNGKVGVGTTSPTGRLQVEAGDIWMNKDNASSNYYLRLNHKNNRDGGMLWYRDNLLDWQMVNKGGTGDLGFYSYGVSSYAVTLQKSTGNVGIGTTSPNEKLTVAGNVNIQGTGALLRWNSGDIQIRNAGSYAMAFDTYTGSALTEKMRITSEGNVGIGTTLPSSELEVAGKIQAEKLEVARYSNVNAPAPVYIGRSGSPMGQGGIFRLAAIESSSTVNKVNEPFLITYSSGHWGSQPTFMAEFTVTYYRSSYVKYWCQHEVSGSRLEFMQGPFGGQIISGGAPVSRTITLLCSSCHGGQPVYKCVWKWSNSGTYIKTSPVITILDGPGSSKVFTSGSSTESAVDALYSGSSGSPGAGYFLMGINNAQASGFTGLATQN